MDTRPTPPGPQSNAATLTTATTGVVVLALERWLFHGALPPEVYLFVQLAIPAACGRLAAEVTYRRAVRHLDCP